MRLSRTSAIRSAALYVGLAVAFVLTAVDPAAAGTCAGFDPACHASPPGTYSGSLNEDTGGGENVYALDLKPGTILSVSIRDTEDPSCSAAGATTSCGGVYVDLYVHGVEGGDPTRFKTSATSAPSGGSPAPTQTFTYTVSQPPFAGRHYLDVQESGGATDANGDAVPVPYTLQVSWTAPAGGGGSAGGKSGSASVACKNARAQVNKLRLKVKHAHSKKQKRTLKRRIAKARSAALKACGA